MPSPPFHPDLTVPRLVEVELPVIEPTPVADACEAARAAVVSSLAGSVTKGMTVAVGGGSPIDCAKAIAILATNPLPIQQYMGRNKVGRDGVPLVAIPIHLTYRAYAVYSDRLEYEHRHREIIESLNEGMAVIDHEGQVTLWNDALERMLGSSRSMRSHD